LGNLRKEGVTMERTESTVVQVAPDYENAKIKEMEMFGWNLQSRQEIHEEGEAYSRPSYLDSSTYVIKTKVKHYVKLHFVRPLNLPRLDQIKQIESEYFNLSFPVSPSLVWPVVITLLPIPGTIAGIFDPKGPGFAILIVTIPWIVLGYRWIKSRMKKRNVARETCEQSLRKMEELKNRVASLT